VTRKTVNDFPPEVLKLFDGYVHGRVTRREFLDRAAKFAVGGVTAAGLLEMLQPNFALGEQIAENDARVRTQVIDYPSPQGSGTVKGYLAEPAKASGKRGCIVVIHENRGLNPHIKDIARRLALEGYTAFAPDALAPVGGYPGDEDKAREIFSKLDPAKRSADLFAAVDYVKTRGECNGRIGAIGFCFGGGVVNQIAVRYPDLAAGVPFYGAQPKPEDVPKIKASMQMHYADNDDNINKGIAAYEDALRAAHVRYEIYRYAGTYHGFNNDTTPRYDENAAKLAWSRSLGFFKECLKA
jgi:carboxymethylenebutenolidase